jgi:hypothetical protein
MTRRQERAIRVRESKVSMDIPVLSVTHEEEELCALGSGAEPPGDRSPIVRAAAKGVITMRDTWTRFDTWTK